MMHVLHLWSLGHLIGVNISLISEVTLTNLQKWCGAYLLLLTDPNFVDEVRASFISFRATVLRSFFFIFSIFLVGLAKLSSTLFCLKWIQSFQIIQWKLLDEIILTDEVWCVDSIGRKEMLQLRRSH